ncbi:gamma-aminobutyric acid receptor subunit beta-like protein [Dinothrombium tinctorium]|uniref:Gamma-aminobutyric acid receptor subunit beta-like protein n=1 Tax=Dinothrombium tinctorium TaxID=1965070 RepID=A0A443QEP8_9ACAR|nr:gamma-aminobutyric acid receptor subunit beta-like protein [Dinothrombium tinctorium]RWS04576.1 gamma-aminobutyric acid receptor subunit beta-like protein [Dinothrombium tinctorium]
MLMFVKVVACYSLFAVVFVESVYVKDLLKENFETYDKYERPNYGERVNVTITAFIADADLVKETYDYLYMDMNLYFRESWNDPRLQFVTWIREDDLLGGEEVIKEIWKPDTFFPNTLSVRTNKEPNPEVFVRINRNGDVLLNRNQRKMPTGAKSIPLRYTNLSSRDRKL